MADLTITYPVPEATNSLEIAQVTAITIEDEMTIIDAMKNKNNSLHVIVKATTAGDICFKAGNNYPNAMLGDCYVHCETGYNDIIIEDISRFENRDNTIVLEKSGDLAGEILAVAKRAGMKPVA